MLHTKLSSSGRVPLLLLLPSFQIKTGNPVRFCIAPSSYFFGIRFKARMGTRLAFMSSHPLTLSLLLLLSGIFSLVSFPLFGLMCTVSWRHALSLGHFQNDRSREYVDVKCIAIAAWRQLTTIIESTTVWIFGVLIRLFACTGKPKVRLWPYKCHATGEWMLSTGYR